jgi:hypothetical protein
MKKDPKKGQERQVQAQILYYYWLPFSVLSCRSAAGFKVLK